MDLIQRMPDAPDAIFTGNDQVAAGLIKQAISYGYHIPKDLAVIGYDNQDICEVTAPTITTIDIPIVELGQQSVKQMIQLLQDQNHYNVNIFSYLLGLSHENPHKKD